MTSTAATEAASAAGFPNLPPGRRTNTICMSMSCCAARRAAGFFSSALWQSSFRPANGTSPAGETSRDAAFREVREELGLRIPPDRLCFAARQIVEEAGRCILDIWYARMDFRAEDCVLQAGEVDGVRLVPFAELAEACRDKGPAYREVLEKIRALCDAV